MFPGRPIAPLWGGVKQVALQRGGEAQCAYRAICRNVEAVGGSSAGKQVPRINGDRLVIGGDLRANAHDRIAAHKNTALHHDHGVIENTCLVAAHQSLLTGYMRRVPYVAAVHHDPTIRVPACLAGLCATIMCK